MRRLLPLLAAVVLLIGCMEDTRQPAAATPSPLPAAPIELPALPEDAAPQTLYAVAARDFLSLRIRPDASADRVKKLAPGAVVAILGEEGEFAFVEELSTGYTGYAMRSYLAELPPGAAVPTPPPTGGPGPYRVAAEEFLTLRALPDTASEALAALEAGAVVEASAFEGNFARVAADGQEGYVLAAYLEPLRGAEAPPAAPEPYVPRGDVLLVGARESLSLRAAPDTAAERLALLPRGERVVRLSREGAFTYVEVEATGDRGYVLTETLLTEAEYAARPAPEASDLRYVDAAEYLTLREEPSGSAEALATLPRGEQVSLLGREGDFAHVEVASSGQTGYVLDGYLSEKPVATLTGPRYRIVGAKESLTLRESASTAAKAVASIPAGERVELGGYDGAFAKVSWEGHEGYVLSGYLLRDGGYDFAVVEPVAEYPPHRAGEDLAALARLYPRWLRVVSAGRSAENRDIPAALLGNPQAEHHILVQAGIHGREHMTSLLAVAQIDHLLSLADGEAVNALGYDALLDSVCFHILPAVNPDGIAISQGRRATPALEAIYRSDLAAGLTDLALDEYLRQWKANAAGVDINRNFDAGWRALSGPDGPSADRYRGASPADQSETRALIEYTKRYDFDATVSYHAYGSFLYWEYGSDARVNEASRSLAKAVREVTRYPLTSSGGVDAGGYKDWAMEARSIPSITIEVGTRPCPLPLDEFDSIWDRNKDLLPALAAWVRGE